MENWNSFLKEGMLSIDNMSDDMVVIIETMHGDNVLFTLVKVNKTIDKPVNYSSIPAKDKTLYGSVFIRKNSHPTKDGECYGSYIVDYISTNKGWGPFLYDLAIEWSSLYSSGLIPDRQSVSKEAYKVWEHYLNHRTDVKAIQLDDLRNTLTPPTNDNCKQDSSYHYGGENWMKDPLSKLYRKEPATTIEKLKKMNKLVITDGEL
jgi:hypothetical protein